MKNEYFTSRWGLIISTLGIAVGTGNIWRFSRIVAQNGGGSFLIPWVIFLLLWSIPLIIAEFAIGKYSRKAPIGAIAAIAGKKFSWMGAFIAFVATAIMFYYSVVAGWCIKYFFMAISGSLFQVAEYTDYWSSFSGSYQPLLFHFFALAFAAVVVVKGISNGVEKTNKVLVPSLIVILLILLIKALTLPNAIEGIKYFFTPKIEYLIDFKVWLNALTQNAWDTGAGWGLIMTYAIYMRKKDGITLNASLIGFGNNTVSIVAGVIIFSTVFALSTNDAMQQITTAGPANTGLTFIYLPLLFSKITDYNYLNLFFASIFFLALAFAALSSLISMLELTSRTVIDFGVKRNKAVVLVSIIAFLLGMPSALSNSIFANQDWVWGVALILSGGFISFAVIRFGTDKFRIELINTDSSEIKIGKWYNFLIGFMVPLQAIVLLVWWLVSSATWDPEWWNPFHVDNAATCLVQWGIVLSIFIIFNKYLTKKIAA